MRDPYIEQRLINWGCWKAGAGVGGLGYASTPWSAFDGGDRYGGSAPVIADDEQAITDQAVRSLPDDQAEAIEHQFVHGGTVEVKAKRLACHPETFRRRVDNGMRGVSRWLTERDRAAEAHREAIESLQRATSEQLGQRVAEVLIERKRTDKILGIKATRQKRGG